ncbi:MAG: histidine triad nucleotide-binding protein [Micavibrio sp.]|nr:histidine triad nucleotide-binding protein [Micavibrio sp.]HCK32396.1 histidine triad nucleotide-binding protein [Rhodospirillaceae bacterium]
MYHSDNIFAKILRKEIPCDPIFENDDVLAFKDISPVAPVHVLVIPKSAYVSMDDFSAKASDQEIVTLMRAVGEVARQLGLEKDGYRVISNVGEFGGQQVPHLHFHILGGEKIGSLRPGAEDTHA